jgi:hypothetical protein
LLPILLCLYSSWLPSSPSCSSKSIPASAIGERPGLPLRYHPRPWPTDFWLYKLSNPLVFSKLYLRALFSIRLWLLPCPSPCILRATLAPASASHDATRGQGQRPTG